MRRAYVVAGIGTLVLAASCSGKPNDLRHYATQDPVSTTATSTAHVASPTTTTSTAPKSARLLTAGLLDDVSVADIGFHPGVPRHTVTLDKLPVCSAPLAKPSAPAAGAQTRWVGASSVTTLTDYVAVYQQATGAQVLVAAKTALTCGQAVRYPLPQPPAGVDASYSWCEEGTPPSCSLLLAKGHLLTRVQVVTTSAAKAQNLLKEVAVPAAARIAAATG